MRIGDGDEHGWTQHKDNRCRMKMLILVEVDRSSTLAETVSTCKGSEVLNK